MMDRASPPPLLVQVIRHPLVQLPIRLPLEQRSARVTQYLINSIQLDLRICKHPKPPASDMPLRKLVEQTRRVEVMHIIVPAPMGQQEVDPVKGRDVVNGGEDIALRIGCGGGHVSLGVDRVVVEPVGHGCDSHCEGIVSEREQRQRRTCAHLRNREERVQELDARRMGFAWRGLKRIRVMRSTTRRTHCPE
jgi:hypothetical protein